jgi:hypothetical protein
MGNHVLVVHMSVLVGEMSVRKGSVSFVANAGLAKVNHGRGDAVLDQHHSCHLSQRTAETVSGGLYRVSRV